MTGDMAEEFAGAIIDKRPLRSLADLLKIELHRAKAVIKRPGEADT